jgi:hypothetical protein
MAAYFLDTSALVKRYHPEAGTPNVDQVFSKAGADIIISRLVLVEIVSAFALKVRSGTISTAKFEQYRKQVHRDVRHKTMRVARMAVRHFQLADELLCRHAIKHRSARWTHCSLQWRSIFNCMAFLLPSFLLTMCCALWR